MPSSKLDESLLGYYSRLRGEAETAADGLCIFVLDYLHAYGPMSIVELQRDLGPDTNAQTLVNALVS